MCKNSLQFRSPQNTHGPQLWSAKFCSAKYPLSGSRSASPSVRRLPAAYHHTAEKKTIIHATVKRGSVSLFTSNSSYANRMTITDKKKTTKLLSFKITKPEHILGEVLLSQTVLP